MTLSRVSFSTSPVKLFRFSVSSSEFLCNCWRMFLEKGGKNRNGQRITIIISCYFQTKRNAICNERHELMIYQAFPILFNIKRQKLIGLFGELSFANEFSPSLRGNPRKNFFCRFVTRIASCYITKFKYTLPDKVLQKQLIFFLK